MVVQDYFRPLIENRCTIEATNGGKENGAGKTHRTVSRLTGRLFSFCFQ